MDNIKELSKLDGKKVRIAIKQGWTVEDFCLKYGCGPCELRTRIDQLFTVKNTANDVWSAIKANDKKRNGAKKHKDDVKTDVRTEVEAEVREPDATEEVAGTTTEAEDKVSVAFKRVFEQAELNLDELSDEELKALEEMLSTDTIAKESRYKQLYQQYSSFEELLRALFGELETLKKSVEGKINEVNKTLQSRDEILHDMNEIIPIHNKEQKALEVVRGEIKERSKIVICVYGNREIAPFDETAEVNLDDHGHEALFESLRVREEAEDFKPKDLRVVARLIKIVTNLNVPVEIIFEDEEIKMAYELFSETNGAK